MRPFHRHYRCSRLTLLCEADVPIVHMLTNNVTSGIVKMLETAGKAEVEEKEVEVRQVSEREIWVEEKIRQQNEFLNRVLDSLTHPFYVIDVNDYTVKLANAAAKLGDLAGKPTCYALTHKSDRPCAGPGDICTLEEVKKTGKPVVVEHIHYDEDGNARSVEVHGYPVFDAEGNLTQMIEYCLDITERKQAEEALKQAEEKYRTILEEMEDAYFEVDLEGNYTFVNDAHCRAMGYSREETIGMNSRAVTAEEDYEYMFNAFRHAYETGEPIRHLSYRMVGKDGEMGWTEVSAVPLRNQQGAIIGFRGIGHDITERNRAEEKLRESEERYRDLFESTTDLIQAVDPEGRFVHVNRAWRETLGYTEEEIASLTVFNIIHPDYLEHCQAIFRRVISGESVSGIEAGFLARDGSTVLVEGNASCKFVDGKPVHVQGIFRNITERKRTEQELQKVERLESVGTLAGGIAHDFNNILTGILGNISLAKRYVESGGKAAHRLQEAEKASLRAKDLTQQLLTFTKGGEPVRRTASIRELIQDFAQFALRGSRVRSVLTLADDLWAVEIDEGQMNQVISNLVINADEAMPEGGTLNIEARNTVIEEETTLPLPEGKYVEVTVADHGVGIPEEHLDKIFEPYFTTKQKGSGLGLATAYSIIQNHDGYISAESELGTGTTFHIYLPASKKRAPERREAAVQPAPVTRVRILVMDDEEIIRDLLHEELTDIGYEVELTEDGADAIERYARARDSGQPFAALIMDLTIPGGMGGQEAIGKLLEIDPEAKVVVSSGYSTDPIMADFKEYGFSAVAAKPYSTEELEETLRGILKGKK